MAWPCAPDDAPDVIAFPVPAARIQLRARLAGLISEYRPAAGKPRPAVVAKFSTSTGRSWAGAARAESAGGAAGAAGAAGIRAPFEIDEYTRWRLMEGLDDIGLTLRHVEEITAFERSRPAWLPVTS